uniref:Receptor activity modifying protein 2 n=1 Tax=Chelydra serpentina TaxID=8475 RepID=A0A8C3XRT2_CHESE
GLELAGTGSAWGQALDPRASRLLTLRLLLWATALLGGKGQRHFPGSAQPSPARGTPRVNGASVTGCTVTLKPQTPQTWPACLLSHPRPYSDLRHCLETFAEKQNYGYPNSIAEECIVQSHRTYFLNCTQEHPVFFDPPEDVLLILILTPICLIPFLVTLVVWRSKDGKMQS